MDPERLAVLLTFRREDLDPASIVLGPGRPDPSIDEDRGGVDAAGAR